MSVEKHIVLQNNISELNTLAAAIEEFAEQTNIGMQVQFNLNLALDELITNIINYAYIDNAVHQIELTLKFSDNQLSAKIIDDGKAFNPTHMPSPDLASEIEERQIGGLGIHFVKTLMDKMEYQRTSEQNHLLLEKKLANKTDLQ